MNDCEEKTSALMVFKEADKNGWGEARTIGTSLYLIFLNHEERVIATEMLFGGLHLLDDPWCIASLSANTLSQV